MDNAGWHARRKAAQHEVSFVVFAFTLVHVAARPAHRLTGLVQDGALPPSRGPDGQFRPVAQVEPMDDGFIGGWSTGAPGQPSTHPAHPVGNGNVDAQLGVRVPSPAPSPHLARSGYPFVRQPPPLHPEHIQGVRPSFTQSPLSQLNPVERSHALNVRKRTMSPYLQYMCGPLLRYDTVDEHGVWHGAALIVSECRCIRPLLGPWWVALTPSRLLDPRSQLRMPGRRTSRIRLSSIAGIPNIPLPPIGIPALTAQT
jgi:hypothetical protein